MGCRELLFFFSCSAALHAADLHGPHAMGSGCETKTKVGRRDFTLPTTEPSFLPLDERPYPANSVFKAGDRYFYDMQLSAAAVRELRSPLEAIAALRDARTVDWVETSIESSSPLSLRELLFPSSQTYGPDFNCFGAALGMFSDAQHLLAIDRDGVHAELDSREMITEVPVGEIPRFGDIVFLVANESSSSLFSSLAERVGSGARYFSHAAVYIGDGWIAHKASHYESDPPGFEKLEVVLKDFAFGVQPPTQRWFRSRLLD